MKTREILAWVMVGILMGAMAGLSGTGRPSQSAPPDGARGSAAFAAAGTAGGADMANIWAQEQKSGEQLNRLETSLKSAHEKLDNLQTQGGGGRFGFFWAGEKNAYLVRVDRLKGEVAFLNNTNGAKWYVVDLPEMRISGGNAFFQTYVNALQSLAPL